jgi:hypothetical protein
MDEQKEFIFTFGYGQIPGIGWFCRIRAESFEKAREIMHSRTRRYCGQYESEEAAGVERYGLRECFWSDAYKGWAEYE